MVETTGSTAIEQATTEQLKVSMRKLLATLIDRAFGLALDAVEGLARTFDDVAARRGLTLSALFGGARAVFEGRNPSGEWSGARSRQ